MQKVVDEQINEWLKDGVISRSDFPFAICLHVVPTKSGKLCVCVDYKRLNAISLLKVNALPLIHSFIHSFILFSIIIKQFSAKIINIK